MKNILISVFLLILTILNNLKKFDDYGYNIKLYSFLDIVVYILSIACLYFSVYFFLKSKKDNGYR